jgi:16S rRNA (cytosine967-C5)-methyltransferase
MARPRMAPRPEAPGLPARRAAADMLDGVLRRQRLVATVLRRLGTLRWLIGNFLDRGFPPDAPRVETALLVGAAQILWLDVPDHAAVDLSVRLVQADRRGGHYAGLVNAVLRRVAQHGPQRLADADAVVLDTPDWLLARWVRHYGTDTARAIALSNGHEPPLDLTVKSDGDSWAARLRGRLLPTGTVRTTTQGAVSLLPGYVEGAWWVQDAAAALPVRLFGDVRDRDVADLCAAPGGKTAQLSFGGARVTAVDRSVLRLTRLRENLVRLRLEAATITADATEWQAGPFDAVLVDAPCSSTGTIRRHPDIPWLKREADISVLVSLQRRLLERAIALAKPGGTIVYCTCSLEPEENEMVIADLLAANAGVRRQPVMPSEIFGLADLISPAGDLRTLPCHLPDPDPRLGGLDGFYAARLQKI